jgi:hypothetical protein
MGDGCAGAGSYGAIVKDTVAGTKCAHNVGMAGKKMNQGIRPGPGSRQFTRVVPDAVSSFHFIKSLPRKNR